MAYRYGNKKRGKTLKMVAMTGLWMVSWAGFRMLISGESTPAPAESQQAAQAPNDPVEMRPVPLRMQTEPADAAPPPAERQKETLAADPADPVEMRGKADEHNQVLQQAFTQHSQTQAGAQAALRLADRWYEMFVVQKQVKARWEAIRDAYSAALLALDKNETRRQDVISRLDRLNDELLFGKLQSSGVSAYTIQPGDSLWKIAHKFKVSEGSIMRLNRLKNPNLIREGQRLKILTGERHIVVNRGRLTLTLYLNSRFFREYPVGIGPDDSTPTGVFTIATKLVDPHWFRPSGPPIPPNDPLNILGTRWLGFARTGIGAGIGIHGTTKPESVPGRESAGCVRMLNPDVEEVFDWVTRGTKVTIVE